MQNETSVEIRPGDLAQIVAAIFQSMLGLEVSESSAPWVPSDDRLTATVHMTGSWNGAISLACSRQLARRFAASFLSLDPAELSEEVIYDVMGELANMIGGNLKCVLTEGLHLSMPSVVGGQDFSICIRGAEISHRLSFHCAPEDFWITALRPRSQEAA